MGMDETKAERAARLKRRYEDLWQGGAKSQTCDDLEIEYERGKQHGADDLRMSQNHCRALQGELDEARRENAKLRYELSKLTKPQ